MLIAYCQERNVKSSMSRITCQDWHVKSGTFRAICHEGYVKSYLSTEHVKSYISRMTCKEYLVNSDMSRVTSQEWCMKCEKWLGGAWQEWPVMNNYYDSLWWAMTSYGHWY